MLGRPSLPFPALPVQAAQAAAHLGVMGAHEDRPAPRCQPEGSDRT